MRTATLVAVHTGRHAALYGLGRLEEADEEYRTIEGLCPTVAGACGRDGGAGAQPDPPDPFRRRDRPGHRSRCVSSASPSRPRTGSPPSSTASSAICTGGWTTPTTADDLARPDVTDPALLAACPSDQRDPAGGYSLADPATLAWLSLEALRIWLEHGPGPALVGPVSLHRHSSRWRCAATTPPGTGPYGGSWRLGEARGYEPGTSQARFLYAALACWSEPLENGVEAARRAREGLLAGGDLAYAIRTYFPYGLLPAGLRTVAGRLRRRGGGGAGLRAPHRQRRGQRVARLLPVADWCAARRRPGRSGGGSSGQVRRATRWRCFTGTSPSPSRPPSSAIWPAWCSTPRRRCRCFRWPWAANTLSALARLLRGLALAGQARAADGGERGALLAELDEVTRWLAARAADAPDNFLHLLRLVEAERAWAAGDFRAAGLAYRRRPPRGRRAPAALAPGPDRRTRGPVLPRPRPGACRLRASRPGPPAVPRLGRDREG